MRNQNKQLDESMDEDTAVRKLIEGIRLKELTLKNIEEEETDE